MDELRWALMVLGLLFLAGLALWEWRKPRARASEIPLRNDPPPVVPDNGPSRREPSIDEFVGYNAPPVAPPEVTTVDLSDDDLPEIHAEVRTVDPIRVGISSEEAVDIPGATTVVGMEDPRPIRWPPEDLPERVLGLRVVAMSGPLGGKPVRLALQAAGLRHGPQQIFHKTDRDGNVLASVANLVRPGSLIPDQMDSQELRGLSLFAVLPGPLAGELMLDGLVQLARQLASRLGAVVQDEHGQELDAERLNQLRRAVVTVGEDPQEDPV